MTNRSNSFQFSLKLPILITRAYVFNAAMEATFAKMGAGSVPGEAAAYDLSAGRGLSASGATMPQPHGFVGEPW